MRSTSLIATGSLSALLLASCAGDGSNDSEAPTISDLRVAIDGDFGVSGELNTGDVDHVMPGPDTAEMTVIARDDTTAVDALTVEVVDADGAARTPVDSSLSNGLWRVRVAIAPGDELRARVTDEAGNQTTSEHALLIPTLAEAMVGKWEIWFFDDTKTRTHKWLFDSTADGWSETRQDSGLELTGTWQIDGQTAMVSETTRSQDPIDTDTATVERRRDGRFHVDAQYMAFDPYYRMDSGTGLPGTWTRSWSIYEPDTSGALVLAEEVSETLTTTDTDWSESRTVTDHRGGTATDSTTTRAGTYRIEINGNYSQDVGNFLVRTIQTVDGSPVTASEDWELYLIRLDALLISPMLRQ